MDNLGKAEQALKDGDPNAALTFLQEAVRGKPADPKLRTFLFQLLSVAGQWERALGQLTLAAELDASAIPMAQMYRGALHCEALRTQVLEGKKAPMVMGQPEQWEALMIEALLVAGQGRAGEAVALRNRALEEAPPTAGTMDGEAFAWIADADMRFGPSLEAIINGKYYWVPFARIARIAIEPPVDLRDIVWLPATLTFTNEGEIVALLPARYPGSAQDPDPAIVLGRKTVWQEIAPEQFSGLGQRVLATDAGDRPLLEVREVTLTHDDVSP